MVESFLSNKFSNKPAELIEEFFKAKMELEEYLFHTE